jgi:hypothetical protein
VALRNFKEQTDNWHFSMGWKPGQKIKVRLFLNAQRTGHGPPQAWAIMGNIMYRMNLSLFKKK